MDGKRARRKAYALARELGMDREERIELAQVLLANEDIESWGDLSDGDYCRLLDGMEGFVFIQAAILNRPPIDALATGVRLIEWPTSGPAWATLRSRIAAIMRRATVETAPRRFERDTVPTPQDLHLAAAIIEELARD